MKTICDIKSFRSKIATAMLQYRMKRIPTIDELKIKVAQIIEDFGTGKSFDVTEITSMVYNIAEKSGVVDQSSDFFSKANISNLLIGAQQGIKRNELEANTEQLTDAEQVQLRLEANRKFLDDAYGLSLEVKNYVINQTNQNIFDCCFINRGSISEINKGIVRSNSELNNNIRQYQQILVNRMVDYFKYIINNAPNLKKSLSPDVLKALENPQLYIQINSSGDLENSGILNTLKELISLYLTPEHFTSDILTELYNIANNSNKSDTDRKIAKQRLDAYNAYIILNHFDSYLSVFLGKAIEIKDFNIKTGADKYQISGKTSTLATTWRISENINVESEADAITKLAINTTPLYLWQKDDAPIEGKYLHFKDFEHIIAKIKDLSFREDVIRLKFDENFQRDQKQLWESLSPETQNFLSGKNFSTAINYIRKNPRQYISAIFEILTNQDFYDLNKTTFFSNKMFTDEELNKIYSISKGIFHPKSEESLYTLSSDSSEFDYYSFVTQTVDTIFNVNFLQYYRDSEGVLQVRTFIDQSINNIKRTIETTINTNNSIKLINDFNEYSKNLNLKSNPEFNSESNSEENFKYITFTLPINDYNIQVRVIANSGKVEFKDLNGGIVNFQKLWNEDSVKKYIDSVLRIGISSNIELQESLKNNIGSYKNLCQSLLQFAARVHLNQYVSYNIIKDLKLSEIKDKINSIYGKNAPKYNYQLDELGLIHGNDIDILKRLALVKANLQGVTTAIQVKDGEGNGQNLQTLSRLLGSINSQWDLMERLEGSATKECMLLSVPGLYEGVLTAKEYHSESGDNKVSTEMSVSEMAYSSIFSDFIGGLCNQDDNSIIGNGHVLFLPSVNSDKSTIGRLKINLNKEVTINGITKSIKQLNSNELETIIASDLGNIYTNIYKSVTNDWKKLYSFIKEQGYNIPELSDDFLNGFSKFNSWWNAFKDTQSLIPGKTISQTYGSSPSQFIKYFVQQHNELYPLYPIELIDQVHYKNNKGNLAINKTLISHIARFNPTFLLELNPNFKLNDYPNSKQFWELKKAEMLKSLLKSKFRINVSNTEQVESKYIRDNYSEWINNSGDLILGKAKINGENINITANRDLILLQEQLKVDSINDLIDILSIKYSLRLNPILEQYNYLQYFFTQEFMISTVGSMIAHPEKSKPSVPIIWAHPGIGKTYAIDNTAYKDKLIDWDVEFNRNRDEWIAKESNTLIGSDAFKQIREEYLIHWYKYPKYKTFVTNEWNRIKALASAQNKILVASPHMLLDLFGDEFNTILTMSREDFINRGLQRGDKHPDLWKDGIDATINKHSLNSSFKKKVKTIKEGMYLTDLLDNGSMDLSLRQLLNNVLMIEAGQFQAQHKRNVSYTAAVHAFQLNLLNGIPEDYNIAVIEDIEDYQGTIIGGINTIKPFDGATFVNPFVVLLENNSLGGARAGITKKQFVHFKNAKTGTGGIIKTAGFGLTNDWIRNSPFLEDMMQKMTNRKWVNQNGFTIDYDIIYDYNGNKIQYKDIYYKEGNDIFKVISIERTENGQYQKVVQKVNENGIAQSDPILLSPVSINTNYQLWNFFGGKYSMVMKNRVLELSNTSVENVVIAMNNIGDIIGNPSKIETQEQLWQPLKNSDIHYIPTAGAVKQGAANINSANKYNNPNEKLDIQRIKMYQAGIQLDKEHHADSSELSLMTQVVSACAAKGYTFEAAASLYDALSKATSLNTLEHLEAIKTLFDINDNTKLQEILFKTIINALSKSSKSGNNLINIIASDLIEQAREGSEINFSEAVLPLSDNTIYAKVCSIISSYLTNTGIKAKIPGILSVLTPSYGIFKLWADKKYEAYKNPEQELAEIQATMLPVYDNSDETTSISNIELGRTYKVTRFRSIPINFVSKDGVSLENEYRKIIYQRLYDIAPSNIRGQITKIINGNSKLSLREIIDKLVNLYPDEVSKQNARKQIIQEVNKPISKNILFIESGKEQVSEQKYLFKVLGNIGIDILDQILTNSKEDIEKVLTRYNLQEYTDLLIQQAKNYAATNNIQVTADTYEESVQIITPNDYKKLKSEVKEGSVYQVVEDVTVGRDLAAYNVRFKDILGESYQLWDLDSANALFQLDEIKKSKLSSLEKIQSVEQLTSELLGFPVKDLLQAEILIRRMLQRDLMNLSTSTPDLMLQYQKLLESNDGTENWYKKYSYYVNIWLGTGNGDKININGGLISINTDNFAQYENQIRQMLESTTKVKINNNLVAIDKSSIKTQAYEAIMSKRFATAFGLKEFDSLQAIKDDPDFFIKQYINNQSIPLSDKHYSVALKNSNGNHYYLQTKEQVLNTNLSKLENIHTATIDGTTYRVDQDGNILYELIEGTEIYKDSKGNEIIVTNNLNYYIENLEYDSIQLSDNLKNHHSVVRQLLQNFKKSKNKQIKYFYRYITAYSDDINQILEANKELNNITLDNYKTLSETHPIIKNGRNKHTSFLKSLDIIAARIPAQSMQSFMAMKVVAFDNPDINTAYVSTLQLLLQGSDFDIDTVSLATFDVDSNGILQLWSPYANIQNFDLLTESLKLPIPSGKKIDFAETNGFADFGRFLVKYSSLFNINTVITEDGSNTNEISLYDPSQGFILNTIEKIQLFINFIKDAENLVIPSPVYYEKFAQALNAKGLTKNITANHIPSLIQQIKLLIDNHNLYFDNISKSKLTKVINNYSMHSMHSISIDPVNLIQSHSPVDSTTGPLKDIADESLEAKESLTRTPGNAINQFESIVDNQVGKKGISICATGLKTFFGLTHYYNFLLNHGSEQDQQRIIIGNKHNGITINGKTYRTLANIRPKDPNSIQNIEVLKALALTKNDTDAALILSALLSLSTDNAKELKLSKLNASPKTLGLYVYGVSIGMEFKDIANIMMSNVGRIISDVVNDDVFSGKEGFGAINDSLFKYFDNGPWLRLQKFNVFRNSQGDQITSPLQVLTSEFEKLGYRNEKNSSIPEMLHKALAKYARSSYPISEKIKYLESLRLKYHHSSLEGKQLYNQLIDFVQDYIQQGHVISQNQETYEDIRTLAQGAAEMKILGQLFSLNQGLKNSTDEITTQINNIERAIYNKTGNLEDLIDLSRFAFDEDYRKQCINKYEEVKHSFNILEAISITPHFMEYVKTLATASTEMQSSFKFRSVKNLVLPLSQELEYTREDKIIRGIQNFIGDYLRKNWMVSKDKTIIIPKWNKAFSPNGTQFTLTQDTPIKLGTDWGDATFRMWMENQVIPNLKEGKIQPKQNTNFIAISDNKFIQDLGNDLITTTISHNPSIIYTLPINMLPRDDAGRAILDKYKSEFNKLASYSYKYITRSYKIDQDNQYKKIKSSKTEQSIPIVELFTYYSMIAHNWKLGEKSLVPILENFYSSDVIKDFHKYIDTLDKSGHILKLENINFDNILPYVAPFESPYSSFSDYLWYRNPDTKKYQLMYKRNSSFEEDSDYSQLLDENEFGRKSQKIKDYETYSSSSIDTNYFPKGQIESPIREFNFIIDDQNFKIEYFFETGKIKSLFNGNSENIYKILKDDLKYIPTRKINGIKHININILSSIIKNKLNCGN